MKHLLSCEVDGCGVTKGVAKGGQLRNWPAKGAICTGARPNRATALRADYPQVTVRNNGQQGRCVCVLFIPSFWRWRWCV